MNSNQDPLDDQLLDALLREQCRIDREQVFQDIETAIDAGPRSVSLPVHKPWGRRLAVIAASMMMGSLLFFVAGSIQKTKTAAQANAAAEAQKQAEASREAERLALADAILEQEEKVEERRKVLAAMVRTKGVIYRAEDSYSRPPVDSAPSLDPGSGVGYGMSMSRPAEVDSIKERYGALVDPSWQLPEKNPLSTFSIDVDNASYSNIRRMIRDGQTIPPDAVRIEECINAFDYNYQKPTGNEAFAIHTTLATCPWNESHLLMKIGIKGREIAAQQRPASNLVFLIDVSGSMQDPRKLPLVKESLKVLLQQLDERDSVAYVVYAGSEGVVLPPTKMTESGRNQALEALAKLEAGGSTNGGSGIMRAYQIARENFVAGGVNRVILASDGDFNVGVTDTNQLVEIVEQRAADNIYLSVLSFGTGNLNDSLLESISKDGNGNYYYIDSIREGRRVFLQRLSGTLITIAKDVKIQVEFNPALVGSYRLIGYANRVLKNEDFNNDKVDAGDIGAGHTVTAFYEIVPANAPLPTAGSVDPLKYGKPAEAPKPAATPVDASDEWLTLKLRHKSPEGDISSVQESVVKGPAVRWQDSGSDFSFASAVSMFGMKLRGMDEVKDMSWSQIRTIAEPGMKSDADENRAEFIGLIQSLESRER